ncbi:MAG: hypothetical protein KDC92_11710 [Bacteroidetes bacterium]|nr:hypothetical protein [Bacteroidota bacterium]
MPSRKRLIAIGQILSRTVLFGFQKQQTDVHGTYVGKEIIGTTYNEKLRGKTKKKPIYSTKALEISANGRFKIVENRFVINTVGNYKYTATGDWQLINDTLILNSDYSQDDFLTAKESFNENLDDSLISVIFNSETQYGSIMVSSISNQFLRGNRNGDTLLVSKGITDTLYISTYPANYALKYIPRDKTANHFEFFLKKQLDDENSYFLEQCSLVVQDHKLIPFSKNILLDVEDGFRKE